jgi:hypothetical protein
VKLGGLEPSSNDTFEVKVLSAVGEDGWEAISVNDSWVLLKRSK